MSSLGSAVSFFFFSFSITVLMPFRYNTNTAYFDNDYMSMMTKWETTGGNIRDDK